MKPLRHSPLGRQSGAAIVELAISITMLLLIAAGIFEFGRTFWYYDALAKATRDGARYLSMAPKETINSVGVPAAKAMVVAAANAANVAPALAADNVEIACVPACSDGTLPTEVTVSVAGYAIDIGAVFPFISGNPPAANRFAGVPLAPSTTMRYMIEEAAS